MTPLNALVASMNSTSGSTGSGSTSRRPVRTASSRPALEPLEPRSAARMHSWPPRAKTER